MTSAVSYFYFSLLTRLLSLLSLFVCLFVCKPNQPNPNQTTTRYGDVAPVTVLGRLFVTGGAIVVGVVFIGLVTTTLLQHVQLHPNEEVVLRWVPCGIRPRSLFFTDCIRDFVFTD